MAGPALATEARCIIAASYNIHSCIGRDGRQDPMRISRILSDIGADVCGLQEVDSRPGRTNGLDQFEFFAEQTGMHAIAAPTIVEQEARYGNVLLSRWPFVDQSRIDLSVNGCEPRAAISAVVSCAGRHVRVVNTHLGLRRRERRKQLARLHGVVSGDSLPTIFVGDYNMWGGQQRALRRLGAPTHRSAAPKTYSSRFPLLALDRIWANAGAHLLEIDAHRCPVTQMASDHLPLKAVIGFADRPAPAHRT